MSELTLRGARFVVRRTPRAVELGRKANRDAKRGKWRAVLKHALGAARAAVVGWHDLTPQAIADLTPGFTTPEALVVMEYKLARVEPPQDSYPFTPGERDELVSHSSELFAAVLAEIAVLEPLAAERIASVIADVLDGNRVIAERQAASSPLASTN